MDVLQVARCKRLLFSSMDDLKDLLAQMEEIAAAYRPVNPFAVKRAHVVARLYAYLCNGVHFEAAKNALSVDFELPRPIIDDMTNSVYASYLHLLKPHKVYAAHKLKAAGLDNKKIAKLLDVTPATVTKYLCVKQTLD